MFQDPSPSPMTNLFVDWQFISMDHKMKRENVNNQFFNFRKKNKKFNKNKKKKKNEIVLCLIYDAQRTGVITKAEMNSVLKYDMFNPSQCEKIIKECYPEKEKISYDEFLQWVSNNSKISYLFSWLHENKNEKQNEQNNNEKQNNENLKIEMMNKGNDGIIL